MTTETRQPARQTTETRPESTERESRDELLTLNLPMVSFQVHRPHMPQMRRPQMRMPHVDTEPARKAVRNARTAMPPPERIAYYGGLGALAAFGVIEWPVAAAIGAGTVIAQRARGMRRAEPSSETARPKTEAAAEPTAETAAEKPKRASRTPRASSETPSDAAKTARARVRSAKTKPT
ncbi:hypothetical protein HNP84_008709 [Thermocatellispora tengchongensis]|uniref:Uncharacterized protein n=1 Tax=Thermocatellispora tengchongensis TaxID=1073253 RepID=A0A840PPE3_9ACTN|nr:hypothetical protein [Thermocatellispora tengchongensis]MBB5138947.1 hypothetical protein [Thermocatellispora tengchongensis]